MQIIFFKYSNGFSTVNFFYLKLNSIHLLGLVWPEKQAQKGSKKTVFYFISGMLVGYSLLCANRI